MGRHVAANGITLLIVALVFAFGLIQWGKDQFYGPGPLSEPTIVEIPSGASVKRITSRLVDAGAISSGWIFQTGLNYSGQEESLKFGIYEIPAGASMEEVANLLSSGSGAGTRYQATFRVRADSISPRLLDRIEGTNFPDETPEQIAERINTLVENGDSIELRVAIPEGLTSYQIVEGLRAMPFMDGEVAEIPVEGSLAPNTFSIRVGSDRQEIIDRMQSDQEAILARVWEERDPELPLENADELLVLASIIEKETGVSSERGQVSSVFVNRLRLGMRLQTDPTVIYGITQGREVLGRGLRRSELDAATPYNTYVIEGLPPGPIANPGRLAIEAAAKPDTTDFLFFVADGSGGHAFAQTLAQHEANVVRWRQIEAERAAN